MSMATLVKAKRQVGIFACIRSGVEGSCPVNLDGWDIGPNQGAEKGC
jgi:hypothetical protein